MRRWVVLLAVVLVLLLGTPLACAWYTLYTPKGLALVLRLIPRHLPGEVELSIEGGRGVLAREFHLDLLELRFKHFNIRLRDVELRPALGSLVLQTLQLRAAKVGQLEVQVFPRPHTREPLQFLPHWLNLHVDSLRIEHFHLIQPSGHTFDASNFETHGIARARIVRFYDASMNTGAVVWHSKEGILRGARTLGIEAGLELDYEVDPASGAANGAVNGSASGQVPWKVTFSGNGDLDDLGLSAHIQKPFDATYTGRALDLSNIWRLNGDLAVRHIDLFTWGGSRTLGVADGTVHVEGNLEGFTAQGPMTLSVLEAGVLNLRLKAAYANHGLAIQELQATHPRLNWTVTARGSFEIVPGGPRLDLNGDWNDLRLPLSARDGLLSHSATFSVNGIWPYAARSAGDLQIPGLPALSYQVTGSLFGDHADLTDATLASPGGGARFSARLSWPPNMGWSASGVATDFDPSVFGPLPPGRLGFGFDARGAEIRRLNTDFNLRLRDLTGAVRGLPTRGAGTLARQGSNWRFSAIRAEVGGAGVALDGAVGDDTDVKFDLRAPDLGLLRPGWHGHLNATGSMHGSARDPVIDVTASGGAIQYGPLTLGNLDARIDMDGHRASASRVQLHVRALGVGSRHIDDALLKLDGATTNHELSLRLAADDLRLEADGRGNYSEGVWRADMTQMRAHGDAVNLALENPVNLLLSSSLVNIDQICLAGQPARVCAGGNWTPARWSLNAEASDLPMQTLTAGQTGNLDYRGDIGLRLALNGGANQRATGSLSAQLSNAKLLRRLANGGLETNTLGSGAVSVNAAPDVVTTQLGLDAGALGSIKGEINVQRGSDDWHELPLSGQVAFETAELDFIHLYVPQVDRAAGRLGANLTLGGTLGSPLLNGGLRLTGGELDLYRVNLAMRDTRLDATLADNALQFDGTTQLGKGHAQASGSLLWRDRALHGGFKLSGENLRVADALEAQIDASPDLNFNIDDADIAVSGVVKIPRARIAPADLTNAVLASSDEVIVSANAPADSGSRFKVRTEVTLTLGDDVSVESRGLKARLIGSITAKTSADDPVTRATGEVSVAQGDYTAYGRKLDIDRGRLIFNGGPVSDPGIDVRAVKRFYDPTVGATLAGINVRGTLSSPSLSFFSEPPLPQQQIAQLILAGGGLMASQSNAGTPGATNASRGATNNELIGQGAAILGQQLGSKIGITDVGVESNIYNETSLVLGRYLSPRLYISYGLGLTQTLNTVKLRYTLGDHWMIRTEAGQVGGADLVYTLEK